MVLMTASMSPMQNSRAISMEMSNRPSSNIPRISIPGTTVAAFRISSPICV